MQQSIIQKIEITGLFGQYLHELPKKGNLSSPAILYGDNGVGKSTILNMVFHLLSAAGDKGHRTALRGIPFGKISISLSSGHTLIAEKGDDFENDGILTLQIRSESGLIVEWEQTGKGSNNRLDISTKVLAEIWERRAREGKDKFQDVFMELGHISGTKEKSDGVLRGQKAYLDALKSCAPAMFYLNADRKLDSDSVSDPGEILELRQAINQSELKRATDILKASRAISLKQALTNASRWVNGKAVLSVNLGSENVHSVYETIIDHLAIDSKTEDDTLPQDVIDSLIVELNRIESDAHNFAQYELTSSLKMEKFKASISTESLAANSTSAKLITPYLRSLKSRLEAIRPIFEVLDNFVTTVNEFLSRKEISYQLSKGFVITNDHGDILEASQLSSGEQQLLLIFSYVLAARDTPSVFIIDEPEISLNIKWQRKIVNSLTKVSGDSKIQFILASHSIELITQHMDNVVEVD